LGNQPGWAQNTVAQIVIKLSHQFHKVVIVM
jgi:hypothetical protein